MYSNYYIINITNICEFNFLSMNKNVYIINSNLLNKIV